VRRYGEKKKTKKNRVQVKHHKREDIELSVQGKKQKPKQRGGGELLDKRYIKRGKKKTPRGVKKTLRGPGFRRKKNVSSKKNKNKNEPSR